MRLLTLLLGQEPTGTGNGDGNSNSSYYSNSAKTAGCSGSPCGVSAPMPTTSVPMGAESTAEAAPVGVSRLQRLSLSLPSEQVEQVPEPFQPA